MNKKSDKQRERLRRFALKKLGAPYKYAVKKSEIGKLFDCSSLTQYLYRRIGIEIPRSTILQASCGRMVPTRKHGLMFQPKDLKVGDLLFFKGEKGHYNKEFPQGIGHLEMYLGNGKLIEACGHGRENNHKVRLINLKKELKRGDFCLVKRILKN